MAHKVTTLSVHPDRAERLRDIRDEQELGSLDAALEQLLNERRE